MKIIPEILVTDPEHIALSIRKTADDIVSLLHQRVTASVSVRNLDSRLYVYIGMDVNVDDSIFSVLDNQILFGSDESLKILSETANFTIVLKKAVEKHIVLPSDVRKCFVYLSLSSIDKSRLLKSSVQGKTKGEEPAKPNYKAVDPLFSLDEVVMNPDEKEAIMRAVALVQERQLIFDKWNFRKVDKHTKSILCFHGVPGTGKTMAAHAVARFLGKKILIGSYAQIESEFVGVGAKNLEAFFKCAADEDAVLFIDEADTFLSKRLPSSNDSAKHYNSMSNDLYQLVESFDGCIIFASNHIKDFDPAIISRIIEPIEFKLPDFEGRKKILDHLMQKEFPVIGGKTDELLAELAEFTEGFSGRDLRKALLLCNAEAAFKLKVVAHMDDESIRVPVELVKDCFSKVRQAKNQLDKAMGKKNVVADIIGEFTESKKKNTRYMQMAAHTLLADNKIEPREKALFEELSKVMQVRILLDPDTLPAVEKICSDVSSRQESMQLLDVVTRMAACDEEVPEVEMRFVLKVAHLLGFGESHDPEIMAYVNNLSSSYSQFSALNTVLDVSDADILAVLQKEYTEGAAYYHLAGMYRDGSSDFGGISRNHEKYLLYLNKAEAAGYVPVTKTF